LPIEAVIFDLDGTLAHFNLDYKALRGEVKEYLVRSGVPASLLKVNESIFEMLTKAEIFFKNSDRSEATFDAIRSNALAIAEKYELEAAKSTNLLPGAVETLKELKNMNLKLAICTTSCQNAASYIVKSYKIDEYFQTLITRDKVKHVKPSTEQCETALKTLNVPAKSAIIVGDSEADMKSSRELNAVAVGLTTGFSTKEQLTEAGANYIITALTDLPILIKEINKN
jgi:HAD superfamily hydrolase (TIGR01509 family)